jgi:hypothetical protein
VLGADRGGHARIDGGTGQDRLVLRLSEAQAADPAIQAEIARLQAFLAAAEEGAVFRSRLLGLHLRDVEAFEVEVAPAPGSVSLAAVGGGTGGFAVHHETPWAFAAGSAGAEGAGDMNGDGLSDLVIDGPRAACVVLGKADGSPVSFTGIAAGQGGFAVDVSGLSPSDVSVGAAGDLDADGRADVLVGITYGGAPPFQNGGALVVFGKDGTAGVPVEEVVAGDGGFAISGEIPPEWVGRKLAGAGDVNGDGLGDILVAGVGVYDEDAARVYLVFGKADRTMVDLAEVEAGRGGLVVTPEEPGQSWLLAVAGLGDLNGDGLGDFAVGMPMYGNDRTRNDAGRAYVVFGTAEEGATVDLAQVAAGQGGFVIRGQSAGARLGEALAAAGDVNGDAIADLIVGAHGSGRDTAYVVFGKAGHGAVDVEDLAATGDGFAIRGVPGTYAGYSVDGAGDVNGDGLADLLVGAFYHANATGGATGAAFIVFGKTDGREVDLAGIAAGAGGGIYLPGLPTDDRTGLTVAGAGDVNGDGLADVMVVSVGITRVVFGQDAWLGA